jgi:GT2 family glycosyltransferase
MRRAVHAVVIVRRRGDRLIQTLEAIRCQTRRPDTITVVDLTGDPSSEEVFRGQLGRDHTVSIVAGRPAMGWSEALNLGRESLPEAGWAWVLRDDTTPEPDALKTLTTAVDGAPSVVMAGPKQRMADQPGWLREFGETITQWGQRQAIVDRELDQGQYDRMSDVLAVGDAGLLLSLGVFDELGGADTGLDPLDAPLDLGVRARLAGHRVLAVPRSVVTVEQGPADWKAGKKLGSAQMYRLDRQAWLYRRFAYAPWWALVPIVLLTPVVSVGRSAWHFATKRPDFAIADLIATVGALLTLPRAIVAKMRLENSRSAGWSAIRLLRMSPTERRRRRQLEAEAKFARAEENALVLTRPAFWPSGLWLIAALAAFGALVSGPLIGATALRGGGLLPLGAGIEQLWVEARWLQPDSVASVWGDRLIPADPGTIILAAIGSLTWWNPSLAIVWLWVAAPLISGLVAWWAGSQLLRRALPTTLFALLWVLHPSFLSALNEGRFYSVILHIALPWLVATALTAHTSWQRAAQAGFATAVVTSAAPVLWPVVLLGWAVVLIAMGWREPLRAVAGTLPLALVPSLVLFAPRLLAPTEIALLPGLGRFFADPGPDMVTAPVEWWQALFGWSATPTAPAIIPVGVDWALLTLAAGIPLLAVALLVVITPRSDVTLTAGLLMGSGIVVASVAPQITQGFVGVQPVSLWQGTGAMVLGLGVALAAAALIDHLAPERWEFGPKATTMRAVAGVLSVLVAGGSIVAIAGEATRAWSDEAVVVPSEQRTLPALVAAEALSTPDQFTLVIDEVDGGYAVSTKQGAGLFLESQSSLYRQRPLELSQSSYDLATIASAIVQPSAADPLPTLRQAGIRFILFRGDPESDAALAMGRRAEFIPSGQSDAGVLFKVTGVAEKTSVEVPRSPSQASWDSLLWITWLLWGVLALPTERTPRRLSEEGDSDTSLASVLEEDVDE